MFWAVSPNLLWQVIHFFEHRFYRGDISSNGHSRRDREHDNR